MAASNFGILLKKASTVVGQVVNLGLPEISTEMIEITNHSSAGVREFLPSGVIEVGEFTADILLTQAQLAIIKGDIDNKTSATYNFDFTAGQALTDLSVTAFPTKIETGDADAQSPDVLKAKVTFRPTGTMSGLT